jgi:hypothetical protein
MAVLALQPVWAWSRREDSCRDVTPCPRSPALVSLRRAPNTQCVESWMRSRACLDVVKKRASLFLSGLQSRPSNPTDWVLVSSPMWGSWPNIYYCLAVMVLSLWGALSDERMGLSFVRVIICSNKSLVVLWKYFQFCTLYIIINVYKICTRFLSVQAQYSRLCPYF